MIEPHSEGTVVHIAVRPRAGRCRIAGIAGNRLRIEVTAAPEGGEATKQALRTLAEALGASSGELDLLLGARTRHKAVLVRGRSPAEVSARLDQALAGERR